MRDLHIPVNKEWQEINGEQFRIVNKNWDTITITHNNPVPIEVWKAQQNSIWIVVRIYLVVVLMMNQL